MLCRVADLTTVSLAEDRRLMGIMFELKEIPGGIFKKERVVLDAGAGEPDAWLLKESQSFRLRLIDQSLPVCFRNKHQAEMAGINALLFRKRFVRHMGDELVTSQSKCHCLL